jgi:hypothetical protein
MLCCALGYQFGIKFIRSPDAMALGSSPKAVAILHELEFVTQQMQSQTTAALESSKRERQLWERLKAVAAATALTLAESTTGDEPAADRGLLLGGSECVVLADRRDVMPAGTVAAMVWLDAGADAGSVQTIVANRASGCTADTVHNGFTLSVNSWGTADGKVVLEWGGEDDGCEKLTSPVRLVEDKQWVHLALQFECQADGGLTADGDSGKQCTARIFAAGALVATKATLPRQRLVAGTGQHMHVGAHFNSDFPFHGRIRDVKVWQAAVGLEDMQREAAAAASAAVAAHPPLPLLRAHLLAAGREPTLRQHGQLPGRRARSLHIKPRARAQSKDARATMGATGVCTDLYVKARTPPLPGKIHTASAEAAWKSQVTFFSRPGSTDSTFKRCLDFSCLPVRRSPRSI